MYKSNVKGQDYSHKNIILNRSIQNIIVTLYT